MHEVQEGSRKRAEPGEALVDVMSDQTRHEKKRQKHDGPSTTDQRSVSPVASAGSSAPIRQSILTTTLFTPISPPALRTRLASPNAKVQMDQADLVKDSPSLPSNKGTTGLLDMPNEILLQIMELCWGWGRGDWIVDEDPTSLDKRQDGLISRSCDDDWRTTQPEFFLIHNKRIRQQAVKVFIGTKGKTFRTEFKLSTARWEPHNKTLFETGIVKTRLRPIVNKKAHREKHWPYTTDDPPIILDVLIQDYPHITKWALSRIVAVFAEKKIAYNRRISVKWTWEEGLSCWDLDAEPEDVKDQVVKLCEGLEKLGRSIGDAFYADGNSRQIGADVILKQTEDWLWSMRDSDIAYVVNKAE